MQDLFGKESVESKLINREVLSKVFCRTMKGITEEDLVHMMYSKYEAIIDFSRLCIGEKTGEKISMLFSPHRYSTRTYRSISIIEGFNEDRFLSGLARASLFKYGKCKELLYQVLQLGINGVSYVNEFPPSVARDMYIRFSANRILDPCAGWGGRMIGAASIGAFYHGFEPSSKTYEGLVKLGRFLRSFNTGFKYKLEKVPFEDASILQRYDIAFTSPPYYDTEIYTDEDTNSCNRYKSFEDWCSFFYVPLVRKSLASCKHVVLNVGSRRYDLKSVLFDNFKIRELRKGLGGAGGLGKSTKGKESFYLVKSCW